MAYLRDLAMTWEKATRYGLIREQADVIHAVYQRINVRGPQFMPSVLTPEAESHGLALALPEQVNIRSMPAGVGVGGEGLEPPTSSV